MARLPDPRPQPRPRRLAAVAGTCASALLAVAFFVSFLDVDRAQAARLAERIKADTARRSVDRELGADFARVFETVASQGFMTLADLVHYARTAGLERDNVIYGGARSGRAGDADAPGFDRLLWLLLLLAAAPPLGAVLLAGYFTYHGWRRARSPMLILALVVGAMGLVFPLAYQYARYELEPHLVPAIGFWCQLAGGAGLVLVALFGVSIRNWWRVYVGGVLTVVCLALIAWAYLERGFAA